MPVSDNWVPTVGDKILIQDYFYNGINEFEVTEVNTESGMMVCLHDSLPYRIEIDHYRPDIFIKPE